MKAVVIQLISTIIISMPNFFSGYGVSWPSYTLVLLESDNSPLEHKITNYEGSLIGSLPMLGCLMATVIAGFISESIGRKRTLIICGLGYVLCWSIIATAKKVIQILIGRFILGIANGMHAIVVLVYISEYTQTFIRGTMTSLPTFAYVSGGLISYVTGWLCSFDTINYMNITLSVIFVILISCIKETPSYLLGKGRDKEALSALKFYRGAATATPAVLDEMTYLRSQLRTTPEHHHDTIEVEKQKLHPEPISVKLDSDKTTELNAWKVLVSSKPAQRAMVIVSLHIMLVVLMGSIAVQSYAGQLFVQASPNLPSHICSIILAVAVALGSIVSMTLSDLVPRRVLMLTSCMLSSLSLALLATQLRWTWAPQWAAPALVLTYSGSFQFGAGCIPFVQLAECFVPKVRSLANTVAMGCMWIANFIVLAIYGLAVEHLGLDGTFFMFALIGVVATVVAFLFMKETKGVPLEGIQDMYAQGYLYRKSE